MNDPLKTHVNLMARSILAEMVGVLVMAAGRQGKLDEPNVQETISRLRGLVGPMNVETFLQLSKNLWEELEPGCDSPLFREHYKDARKTLKKIPKKKNYSAQFSRSILVGVDESDWISDKEIWGYINSIESLEEFSSVLYEETMRRGVSQTLEDLGRGIDEQELIRKIQVMDFTMSELRLLQLVLELEVVPTVQPIEIPEEPYYNIPEGSGEDD